MLLITPVTLAWADDAAPDLPACPPGSVTVVVDATELGGEVSVGCADGAGTGTEALVSAGFVDTRDEAGMICAIDSRPDPCPAEFTGVYWSYWTAEDDGWQARLEGSDTAKVAPGAVEGWRYGDGSDGPSVTPDQLVVASADDGQATGASEAEPSAAGVTVPQDAGMPTWVLVVVGIGLLGVLGVVVVRLTRRDDAFGPAGQD